MQKRIFILILVFMILVGCGAQNNISITATAISTSTSTQQILKPTPTNIPTKTPTLTPVATLSPEDAIATFTNLIQEDKECKLPCWLGIIPGTTKFNEVKNNFLIFSAIGRTDFTKKWSNIHIYFPNLHQSIHNISVEAFSAGGGGVSPIIVNIGIGPNAPKGTNYSNPDYQNFWKNYFVSGIFTVYAKPEKIFLDTTRLSADPTTIYPFALWVIYPEEDFMVRYTGINSKEGQNLKICPIQSKIEIRIWDKQKSNYEDFIRDESVLAKPLSLGPQPIEEVTDFDIDSFYEKFINSDINTCFNTPASLWPPN